MSTKPTVDEVVKLVEKKILTEDEAKEILFSSQTADEKDGAENMKTEIKFLKELILNMVGNKTIEQSIKSIEKPYYYDWPWYRGTVTYLCSSRPGSNSLTTF